MPGWACVLFIDNVPKLSLFFLPFFSLHRPFCSWCPTAHTFKVAQNPSQNNRRYIDRGGEVLVNGSGDTLLPLSVGFRTACRFTRRASPTFLCPGHMGFAALGRPHPCSYASCTLADTKDRPLVSSSLAVVQNYQCVLSWTSEKEDLEAVPSHF